ncbi:MAG: helix-turn-helix domain-containing protein [Acidobacteriota bacterium]
MSAYSTSESAQLVEPPIEEIASEVALLLKRRLDSTDILRLLQIVFFDVNQAAELLGVKSKTIRAWVSDDVIPYRKANGKVLFLLAELLLWTLPPNDKHTRHRLTTAQACRLPVLSWLRPAKGAGNECTQAWFAVVLLH